MEELQRRGETDFEEIRNMKNIIEHCLEGDLGKVQSQLENNLVDNFKVWWDVPGTNADESLNPKQKDLMNAVATGKFDLRKTWIGQKWGRRMKKSKVIPGLGNYDECKGPEERANFRKDWARMQLNTTTEGKKETRNWQRTDSKKGRYMNFGRVVEQYGIHYDRRKAIKCAWNWCSKAARMGGGWAFHEEQAEVMMFMH